MNIVGYLNLMIGKFKILVLLIFASFNYLNRKKLTVEKYSIKKNFDFVGVIFSLLLT